jgi:hypothetical protein
MAHDSFCLRTRSKLAIGLATKRHSATARCWPEASKQTLAGSIIDRFCIVAHGALAARTAASADGQPNAEVKYDQNRAHETAEPAWKQAREVSCETSASPGC